jgi:O-antigen ligase
MFLSGVYTGPAVYAVVPLMVLLLIVRGYYTEALLNFFFLLILSDSRNQALSFATNLKYLYIVLLGLSLLFIPRNDVPYERTILRFLPFFTTAFLCLIFRDTIFTGLQKTISYALLFLVVPNYIVLIWKKEGEHFLSTLVWFIFLLLAIGFLLKVVSPHLVSLGGRYTGIMGNPNGIGLFGVLFFLLVQIINSNNPNLFSRSQYLLIIGFIVLSILLSGSRNALFALLLFIFYSFFYRISPFLGFISFLLSIITYIVVSINLPLIVTALNLEEYLRLETLEDASGRFIAWDFGWQFIQKDIVFGKGMGYTEELYKSYYAYLSIRGHQGNAHNSFITFWLDTGVFGLFFLLRALVSSFLKGAKSNRYAMPAFYIILLTAFFESWMTASLNPITIQMLMAIVFLGLKETPQAIDQNNSNSYN